MCFSLHPPTISNLAMFVPSGKYDRMLIVARFASFQR